MKLCLEPHRERFFQIWWIEAAASYLTVFLCLISVKLQEGRNPVGEKGWTDKSFGDCKKLDGTNSSCQCVCHSRANVSASATATDTPAVVDLTVSPCKESTLPPPAAAAGQSMLLLAAAAELGWTRFLFLINKPVVQPLQSNFRAVFRAFI